MRAGWEKRGIPQWLSKKNVPLVPDGKYGAEAIIIVESLCGFRELEEQIIQEYTDLSVRS